MSSDIEEAVTPEEQAQLKKIGSDPTKYIIEQLARRHKGEELSDTEEAYMQFAGTLLVAQGLRDNGVATDAICDMLDREYEITFNLKWDTTKEDDESVELSVGIAFLDEDGEPLDAASVVNASAPGGELEIGFGEHDDF